MSLFEALSPSRRRVPVRSSSDGQLIVSSSTAVVAQSFTRPADTTAYASGDLVGNSTTAAQVAPMALDVMRVDGGSCMVRRARLRKSGVSITNASFRVHLFNAAPAVSSGDNAALACSGADAYIGRIDINIDQSFADGAVGQSDFLTTDMHVRLSSGKTIYALLEARGAYTPVSGETFALRLEVVQD